MRDMTSEDTGNAAEAPSFAALPADVLQLLFGQLGVPDVVNSARTCTAWHRCLAGVWHTRCVQRWRHWTSTPSADAADAAAWRDRYAHRHKVDAHILHLLADVACWPERQYEAYSTILAYGRDALDVLAAAAGSSRVSGMYLGIAHRAHTALLLVQGQLAAQHLQQMLAEQETKTAAAAAAAVAAAAATLPAMAAAVGTSTSVLDVPAEPTVATPGGSSAATSSAGSACNDVHQGEDPIFEAALQVNCAMHPLMDVGAVREAVAQLGQELSRRMEAAGAAPHSRKALQLLNTLLFNAPPAPVAAASEGSQAPPSASPHSSTCSGCSRSHSSSSTSITWSSVWPRNDDLYGADLSGFTVPTDGVSGLGLEADPEMYACPYSGCLDTVLAYGTGLPIAMCVLHSAIGRRAGLDVELVNMPGRVINRVRVVKATGTCSASSSSSGSGSCAELTEPVYVDVYNGVELGDDLLRSVLHTLHNPWPLSDTPQGPLQELLPAMTPVSFCRRTVANLLNLCHSPTRTRAPVPCTNPQPPLLSAPMMQLSRLFPGVLESAMHSMISAEGLHNRATARLFIQLFGGCMDSPETASAPHDALEELQHGHEAADRVARRVARALQSAYDQHDILALPIGTCVKCCHSLGFVCDVHDGERAGLGHLVLTPFPEPVSVVVAYTPDKVADNPACCPAGPAGSPDLSTYVAKVQQAQRALQETWFEPEGEFEKGAEGRSCVQQLLPRECARTEVFAAMRSCSKGLGCYFDAVVYDEGLQQWCLVPNACIRHKLQP